MPNKMHLKLAQPKLTLFCLVSFLPNNSSAKNLRATFGNFLLPFLYQVSFIIFYSSNCSQIVDQRLSGLSLTLRWSSFFLICTLNIFPIFQNHPIAWFLKKTDSKIHQCSAFKSNSNKNKSWAFISVIYPKESVSIM